MTVGSGGSAWRAARADRDGVGLRGELVGPCETVAAAKAGARQGAGAGIFILFIQRRPRGLFALRGGAVEA